MVRLDRCGGARLLDCQFHRVDVRQYLSHRGPDTPVELQVSLSSCEAARVRLQALYLRRGNRLGTQEESGEGFQGWTRPIIERTHRGLGISNHAGRLGRK